VNVPHVGQVGVQVHRLLLAICLQSRGHCLLFGLYIGARLVRSHVASSLLHWRSEVRRSLVTVLRLRLVVASLLGVILASASTRLSHIVLAGILHGNACRSQELTEALSISSNALGGLSKWQSVPVDVVSPHSTQVNNALLTAGTVNRPHILLGKHRVFFLRSALLCLKLLHQLMQLFKGFLKLGELLASAFFVGEHVLKVGHQLVQFVHQVSLEVGKVVERGLVVELFSNFFKLFLQKL